ISATSGTSVRLRISFIAAAASSSGTAMRTISQPASTICSIWRMVLSTSVVSVLVIDCTTTGAPPPIWMSLTLTARVVRFIKFGVPISIGLSVTKDESPDLKELRNIQVHDKDHQHQDHGQSGKLDPLLHRHRQCAAEPGHHFFEAEDGDLAAVEKWYRQQVEYAKVQADHRKDRNQSDESLFPNHR